MTSRWLTEKQNKIKKHRQKRAYLKHFPSHLDTERLAQYYASVRSSSFEQTIPKTKITPEQQRQVPTPRLEVQARYFKIMQSDRLQGIDELIRGPCLSNIPGIKIYLWFSGGNYVFIKEYDDVGPVHRSRVYTNREQAYQDFLAERIFWEDIEPLK